MQEDEVKQLAEDYIAYFRGGQQADNPAVYAPDALGRLCRTDMAAGFKVVWMVVNRLDGEDHKALTYLGAGPLEDLINSHNDEMVDLLIEAARENANLCVALSCVWKGAIRETAWQELNPALRQIRTYHGARLVF